MGWIASPTAQWIASRHPMRIYRMVSTIRDVRGTLGLRIGERSLITELVALSNQSRRDTTRVRVCIKAGTPTQIANASKTPVILPVSRLSPAGNVLSPSSTHPTCKVSDLFSPHPPRRLSGDCSRAWALSTRLSISSSSWDQVSGLRGRLLKCRRRAPMDVGLRNRGDPGTAA